MVNIGEVKSYIQNFNKLIEVMPENISCALYQLSNELKIQAQEIRIRINKPIEIISPEKSYFIGSVLNRRNIDDIFKSICSGSVYSFQNQIKNGFITFKGGHRVGIASSVVIENGQIHNIRDITSFNIRIAREFKGCSENIYNTIKNDVRGTLIVGTPSSGKTTLLRDLARTISLKSHSKVTIVDEKSEIAAVFEGEPQMDVAMCDILTGFSKGTGILRAVRCLSPDVIICDEIGNSDDAQAINQSLNSGVKVIASIHAKDERELVKKPQALILINSGAFEKIIFLRSSKFPGEVSKIIKVGELLSDETNRHYFCNHFGNFDRLHNIT